MPKYTPADLQKRDTIIQTHRLFGDVLDADMINGLVYLFDKPTNNQVDTINKYIEDERKRRGLYNTDKIIISEVYGHDVGNTTLHIRIKKNNRDFIHLSIHLTLKQLDPKHNGMIHFVKDIYRISSNKQFYAPIIVMRPAQKPHSLQFSIPEEYLTTPESPNASLYDIEVQQEMDIIITVIDKLFDEKDRHYIGNRYIHSPNEQNKPVLLTTNFVLNNINQYSTIKTRRNTGKYPLPLRQNQYPSVIYPIVRRTISKKNKRRTTRKIKK